MKQFPRMPVGVFALLSIAVVAAGPAAAQYQFVGTRTDLLANDMIDWGSLGPTGTIVPSGSSIVSTGGLGATIHFINESSGERLDQGNGWSGNFLRGEHLIWTRGNGPLTVRFGPPGGTQIYGIGAQFQSDYFGPFTGRIELLDELDQVLFQQDFAGESTSNGDGSAVFAGASSDFGNIRGVRFVGLSAVSQPNDFGINQLSIRTTEGRQIPAVPEPSEWAAMGLLSSATIGLLLKARRRRRG